MRVWIFVLLCMYVCSIYVCMQLETISYLLAVGREEGEREGGNVCTQKDKERIRNIE